MIPERKRPKQPYRPRVKMFLLVTCLSAFTTRLAFAEPAIGIGTATTDQPPSELARLQQEFDRRRAEALRPVASWYRAQLEALQRTLSDQPPVTQTAIAKALAAARETFWQDDQPELKKALLAASWLWRSSDDAEGVATTFRADGSVEHVGMHGTWRITGPCEVTIQTDAHEQFVLRFNASLSAYEADRSNVSGHRVVPVQ
jgi:hypothetical protein